MDFHAIRHAYINLVLDSDVSAREAQAMARHSTPDLTFNVYGRARHDHMAEAVERIAARLYTARERAPSVHRLAVGSEQEGVIACKTSNCDEFLMVEQRGIEPSSAPTPTEAQTQQNCAKPSQSSALRQSTADTDQQRSTLSEQNPSTSAHEKCAPIVHQNRGLQDVVEAWPDLSDEARDRIVEIVKESR